MRADQPEPTTLPVPADDGDPIDERWVPAAPFRAHVTHVIAEARVPWPAFAIAADVPVTVAGDAIQTVGDKPVVFLKVNGGFIAQPVQLGRSDGKRVEVVQGLKAGAPYASAGSFVVKSELGKASAEHTH